jgi:hypothetical protein
MQTEWYEDATAMDKVLRGSGDDGALGLARSAVAETHLGF